MDLNEGSKSISGYAVFIFGNLVHFETKKQSLVALSTAEAKFMAFTKYVREIMQLKNMLIELGFTVGLSQIYGDNQPSNSQIYNCMKRINLQYHYTKDLINKKNSIQLSYVETNLNLADMFMKSINELIIKRTMVRLVFINCE